MAFIINDAIACYIIDDQIVFAINNANYFLSIDESNDCIGKINFLMVSINPRIGCSFKVDATQNGEANSLEIEVLNKTSKTKLTSHTVCFNPFRWIPETMNYLALHHYHIGTCLSTYPVLYHLFQCPRRT